MSQAALMMAARDRLQLLLSLTRDSCDIGLDGKPKPACGELYVAVHPAGWSPGPDGGDVGIDEVFGIAVTITRRLNEAPGDRWGSEIWVKKDTGIEPIARRVALELAGDTTGDITTQSRYLVLQAANEYIRVWGRAGGLGLPPEWEGSTEWAGGFVDPLKFRDGGNPAPRGTDWFSAAPPSGELGEQIEAGVSQTLTFGGARRLQMISVAT